jgi:hypothetical protein
MKYSRRIIIFVIPLLLLMVLPQGSSHAQEPLALNEIKQGQVVAGSPPPSYAFAAAQGEVIEVEILGIAEGFVPQFTILKADNSSLGVWYALNQAANFKGLVQFEEHGQYRLLVNNAGDAAQGLFVITMRTAVLPTVLVRDQAQSGELNSSQSKSYVVEASNSQPLSVGVTILNTTASVQANLKDASGTVVASLGSQLYGGAFNIPPGRGRYTVELSNTALEQSNVGYTLTLTTIGSTAVPGETATSEGGNGEQTITIDINGEQITVPVLPTDGECVIAASLEHANHQHNVRNGPSMANGIVDKIDPTQFYKVVGVSQNFAWYQIAINGNNFWVTYNHMRLGGNCDTVPVTG